MTVSEYRFALVSEWMENGNINEFVGRDEHINRTQLVRHPPISTPARVLPTCCLVG